MSDKHDEFAQRMQQALRKSEDELDELTLARLRAARSRALDAMPQRRARYWVLPASAVAAVLLVVTAVMLSDTLQPGNGNTMVAPNGEVALVEDMEMLSSEASIEFLQDLEFYEWLDSNVDSTV
jgi:hypothetical protein